jgi:sugar lactone lactonase YvrE
MYVGSPATHRVYTIDLSAASPTATMLAFTAGGPNGLTTASDGSLFYSDFSGGHVWRVDSTGTRARVTTTTIMQPNGLAFGPDGALYVDSYGAGTVIRLVLASNMEMSRTTFATGLGSPDGLAFDSMGNLYVTDNAGGRLYRVNADGSGSPMMLMSGIGAAANIEFGAGALSCTDIYVASSGALRRYETGTITGAAVPWH